MEIVNRLLLNPLNEHRRVFHILYFVLLRGEMLKTMIECEYNINDIARVGGGRELSFVTLGIKM